MDPLFVVPGTNWDRSFPIEIQDQAALELESGRVIHFPTLAFPLWPDEARFLSAAVLEGSKNVSYDPATARVGNSVCQGQERTALGRMIGRYAELTRGLLTDLLPDYHPGLVQARTSLRPVEVTGRAMSWRKDDTRLHVDSFPSAPTHGRRILRVFCNINPHGKPRTWRLGEPFADVARRFWPALRPPVPGSSILLQAFRMTRSRRSGYDHFMLQLHDRMKSDLVYQNTVASTIFDFPSGSTWVAFTDQVSHAALAGAHQLEQTFSLPIAQMRDPATSPLCVLESLAGRRLAA